jgi:hypothetical protein
MPADKPLSGVDARAYSEAHEGQPYLRRASYQLAGCRRLTTSPAHDGDRERFAGACCASASRPCHAGGPFLVPEATNGFLP